jgi:hypothetical protein
MSDQIYYDIVANEIESGKIENVLWTRAFAESLGNETKAKALYITFRVNQLKQIDTAPARLKSENQKNKPVKQRSPFFISVVILLAILSGVISIAYYLGGYPEATYPIGAVAIVCILIAIDHFVRGQ